jgi:multidrug efflux pump subunit AcrA (membrane-fusion protein)
MVSIEGAHDWLKPQMSAEVEVHVETLDDVLQVPLHAIQASSRGSRYCFVANGGRPEERPIETGAFNDEFIEVRSGLEEGERVLLKTPEGYERDSKSDSEEEGGNPENRPPQGDREGRDPANRKRQT